MTFDGTSSGYAENYMDPVVSSYYNLTETASGIDGTTIDYNDATGLPHQIKTVIDMPLFVLWVMNPMGVM